MVLSSDRTSTNKRRAMLSGATTCESVLATEAWAGRIVGTAERPSKRRRRMAMESKARGDGWGEGTCAPPLEAYRGPSLTVGLP
jgi:hypothetical protein